MIAPAWLGVALIPDAIVLILAALFGREVYTMSKRYLPVLVAVLVGALLAVAVTLAVVHYCTLSWSSL